MQSVVEGFFFFNSSFFFSVTSGLFQSGAVPVRITPKPEKDEQVSNRINPSPPAKTWRKWKVKIQFNSWSSVSEPPSSAAAAAGLAVRILSPASLAD